MNYLEGTIDFAGQLRCQKYMNYGLCTSAVISYIYGYLVQDSYCVIKLFLILASLVALVCLPAWSMYNKNPLKFQKKKE
ncbi:Microsomal signal peptidase 12 kDa subunit [Schizosaccharomyces pombe]|uniref:Signal peptidase complex subunit 1 n=1 Tax=Schizosaccharomyces pombe (strain 972 / ATCC 24843) TaxID=284812 RepID=SPC1_SCHPO|nr:putative signal peptidase complex subunit Spc1 [Schizosaccharomyces pombe]G2TRR4.1 RecName: Full=Signal peptidase complex subunit 1 [Schizosaccharomyces pombe 972h-]CCD31381.1 signal peptidase complex subunit Spc1 (predicted) [Schizosaccharomyces pombe]|eukprot:NP_001343171.1 putative signal peptidase complex subunit Spc1 [Schizosaccharomyces pombe]